MNNNRDTKNCYPPNSDSHRTYSNQNRNTYNADNKKTGGYRAPHTVAGASQNRQNSAQRNAGNRQSQRNSAHRPPSYLQRPQMNWIPLFAALLLLMISVGIFCTVMNSRSRAAASLNDGQKDDIQNEIETSHDSKLNIDIASPNKPMVSFATANNDTIELGSAISSDYGILIDLKSNTIVAQKNPDTVIFPASMTKIMTLIVAYENCKNFDDTFTMTAEITDPLFIAGASVAGFSVGEEITIRDLLYGAILPSGGDATDALAIYTAGSIEAFVEMMNRKVLQMGLSNTHFANPSGLHDDDHYSTPHEMALILEYALQIDECRKILSTYQYTTAPTIQHPEGILLTSTMFSRMAGDESGTATVLGGKTGFTNEGMHCLASYARVNDTNKEYIFVTAHAKGTYDPIHDCINTYKKLFS